MSAAMSAARARELFLYCPTSGLLTRRKTVRRQGDAGHPAGWLNNTGYRSVNADGKTYLVHRLVWLIAHGEWPIGVIDHINQDKLDNRLSNLRDVTRQINTQNSRMLKVGKKYGATLAGANWDASTNRWKASICINGRHQHLGRFDSEQEAHDVYLAAKRRLHEGCTS